MVTREASSLAVRGAKCVCTWVTVRWRVTRMSRGITDGRNDVTRIKDALLLPDQRHARTALSVDIKCYFEVCTERSRGAQPLVPARYLPNTPCTPLTGWMPKSRYTQNNMVDYAGKTDGWMKIRASRDGSPTTRRRLAVMKRLTKFIP